MADWSTSSRQSDEDEDEGKSGLFERQGSKCQPPNMSAIKEELVIVLLGSNADVKASCGNTIFGRQVFSETPSFLPERHDGIVLNRRVVVINTPDLISPALYPEEQELKSFFHLPCPGAHVLLLVLRSGSFTEQDRDALQLINPIFGAIASEYVIVVFMHEEEMKDESVKDSDSRSVETLCRRRPHHHLQRDGDQSQVLKLLESIEKMMEENEGRHLKILDNSRLFMMKKVTDYQTTVKMHKGLTSRPHSVIHRTQGLGANSGNSKQLLRSKSSVGTEKRLECVRIVLVGKTGVGKSVTGNTILGRNVFESRTRMTSITKMCQRESGDACGRPVTVVDTPGLFDTSLSNEEIQQEIMRCIELSAPGPHVFLLVIALGPITQEERETLQLIKMTFGQTAEAYSMVLFTRGDSLNDESIEDYIKEGDPHVQKLIRDCGGRFHLFNNKQKSSDQVVSLLKKIDKMMWNNKSSFYNDKMFQEAERAFRLMQINREKEEELRREMEAIKTKHESEIKEYKKKLEEERAKGKEREFLLLERENTLLRTYHMRLKTDDTQTPEPEPTQDQCQSQDQTEKHKRNKKSKVLESLKIKRKKKKENLEKLLEEFKIAEAASGEEDVEKTKATDQQMKADLPKTPEETEKEQLLQHQKEMEECRQMLDEAMKKYKETADMYAAEVKKIEARNAMNMEGWEKNHGKKCVLQ